MGLVEREVLEKRWKCVGLLKKMNFQGTVTVFALTDKSD